MFPKKKKRKIAFRTNISFFFFAFFKAHFITKACLHFGNQDKILDFLKYLT
jgi:hypothetical protein